MNVKPRLLSILFGAALAAWAALGISGFEGGDFADRVVSNATLAGVDVHARTRAYLLSLAAFVVAAACLVRWLPCLDRALGDAGRSNLERSSGVGLLLVVLAGLTSLQTDAVLMTALLQLAYVATCVVGARMRAGGEHDQHGSAFLVTAAGAFGILAVTPWRAEPVAVAIVTFAIVWVLARIERAGRRRVVDHALAFLASAAWIVLALVVREEIVLIANQRGFAGVTHVHGSIACAFGLAVLGFALARRRPIDCTRLLARTCFPALLFGLAVLANWTPTRGPQAEMLESANAGLTLQQWFEHGRWPFLDTFDVHGMSDVFMGFCYSLCNGWSGVAWQHWDHVPFAALLVVVYAILARVLANPPLAFVLAIASPFVRVLFPPEVCMAAAFGLVAVWSTRAGSVAAFATTAAAWLALLAWRFDLAVGVVPAFVLLGLAAATIDRERGFAWKRAAVGFGSVLGAAALLGWIVATAHGTDVGARLAEFLRIAGSEAAFGRARIFAALDAPVAFRLFVAPLATLVVAVLLVARARREASGTGPDRVVVLELVFLAAFSLAIFPRGLVRHTFVEHDGTFVTAFQFAVLALAPWVLVPDLGRRVALFMVVALHVLLPLAFDIGPEKGRSFVWRGNTFARAAIRLRGWQKTPVGPARFDRTPVSESFRLANIEPLRELSGQVLLPGETFVDLSASPMLYVFAGARSPHWANHLIVLQGDALQLRFLAELERERAPLLVLSQDFEAARGVGMTPDVAIDEVPIALWHARTFDTLMARSEPFVAAGRWTVWARSDWASPREWGPAGERLGELPSLGEVALSPGETLSLAVLGAARDPGRLRIAMHVEEQAFVEERARMIEWAPGRTFALVDLVTATRPTRVRVPSCASEGGLELGRVRVRRTRDPVREAAVRSAERVVETELGLTASGWGTFDRVPRRTVRELRAAGAGPLAPASGVVTRLEFEPLPRSERSLLCELRIERSGAASGRATVRYGVGELAGGAFRIDLVPGRGSSTYVFRPGMQANWHLRPNTWLEIDAGAESVRVVSARLCSDG